MPPCSLLPHDQTTERPVVMLLHTPRALGCAPPWKQSITHHCWNLARGSTRAPQHGLATAAPQYSIVQTSLTPVRGAGEHLFFRTSKQGNTAGALSPHPRMSPFTS